MTRSLTIGALALATLFAFPVTAKADHRGPRWSFEFGFGGRGPYFGVDYSQRCRPVERHVHCRAPVYRQVWVPPVHERVVMGYDHCGRPISRTIQTRCGYYDTVLVGYRCNGCGHDL